MTDQNRISDDQHNNAPAVPMSESQRADMICAVAAICTGTSSRTVAATAIEWVERYYGITTPAAPSQPAVPQGYPVLPDYVEDAIERCKNMPGHPPAWVDMMRSMRKALGAATPAPAPAPFAPDWAGYRQGLEDGVQSAADLLKRMAVELVTERGETDPDTGAIQFKSAATREWHASLCELAEEIERLKPAKPAQEVGLTDEQKTWAVNQLMEQAQVFASAWSLVGGRHDFGNALEEAEQAKTELRSMVVEALRAKGGKL